MASRSRKDDRHGWACAATGDERGTPAHDGWRGGRQLCSLRSIRAQSQSHVAQMTEVIATSACEHNSPTCGGVHDRCRKRQFATCIRRTPTRPKAGHPTIGPISVPIALTAAAGRAAELSIMARSGLEGGEQLATAMPRRRASDGQSRRSGVKSAVERPGWVGDTAVGPGTRSAGPDADVAQEASSGDGDAC
jgi:hypothetical protein